MRIFPLFPVYEGLLKTHLATNLNTDAQTAFDYSELCKANLLQTQLKLSKALHFAGLPDSLLSKEHELRLKTGLLEKRLNRHIQEDSLQLELNQKLVVCRQEQELLKRHLEHNYPTYYQMCYANTPISLHALQNQLSPQQTILSYTVGDSSIFVFVVRQDSFMAVDLKKDFPLEGLVKQFRQGLYGYHTARTRTDELYEACADSFAKAGFQLYQRLIAPFESALKGELMIIPDGALNYIPFEALLTQLPETAGAFKTHRYLGKTHTISYNYSVHLWQNMKNKQHFVKPKKNFIGFAPYFDGDTLLLAQKFPEDLTLRKDLQPLCRTYTILNNSILQSASCFIVSSETNP
jgi:CHAT domain-containing protein